MCYMAGSDNQCKYYFTYSADAVTSMLFLYSKKA